MTITFEEYTKWCEKEVDPLSRPFEKGMDIEPRLRDLVDGKLREVLDSRELEYVAADWKDFEGLLLAAVEVFQRKPGVKIYYFEPFAEALHGGSDDRVVLFCSSELTGDEPRVVFDLVHNLGAEIPGLS